MKKESPEERRAAAIAEKIDRMPEKPKEEDPLGKTFREFVREAGASPFRFTNPKTGLPDSLTDADGRTLTSNQLLYLRQMHRAIMDGDTNAARFCLEVSGEMTPTDEVTAGEVVKVGKAFLEFVRGHVAGREAVEAIAQAYIDFAKSYTG